MSSGVQWYTEIMYFPKIFFHFAPGRSAGVVNLEHIIMGHLFFIPKIWDKSCLCYRMNIDTF